MGSAIASGVHLAQKKLANPGCKFDTNAKACVCGKALSH